VVKFSLDSVDEFKVAEVEVPGVDELNLRKLILRFTSLSSLRIE
jgi:hypothetical protein